MKASERVEQDFALAKVRGEHRRLKASYNALIKRLAVVEQETEAFKALRSHSSILQITPTLSSGKGEATAVLVASDWHVEERVRPETIAFRNSFTLDVATKRATEFFMNAVKLIRKEEQYIAIPQLILHLGGDFFSGNLHEELMECCALPPIKACMFAKDLIHSGLRFLLQNYKGKILVVCNSGNHARITKRIHIANEAGNSLEYMMFHTLAYDFAGEKRIEFRIEEGHHVYVDVYGMKVRFMHGHAVQYQGGVGGLTIPMNKAVAQWDKMEKAYLTVCGHFHSQFDGGNFLVNGSLIGFNAYALFIKAAYETPRQLFFLLDKKRGKTVVAPILFSV